MSNNDKSNNINSPYNTNYFLEHTDDILNDSYDRDSLKKTSNIERNYVSKVIDDICPDDYEYKESPAFSMF